MFSAYMSSTVPLDFPQELSNYGLDEKLLAATFHQVQANEKPIMWQLEEIPTVQFYQQIHIFLKIWAITNEATKTAIGQFYTGIDRNLGNIYRFIDRFVKSCTCGGTS